MEILERKDIIEKSALVRAVRVIVEKYDMAQEAVETLFSVSAINKIFQQFHVAVNAYFDRSMVCGIIRANGTKSAERSEISRNSAILTRVLPGFSDALKNVFAVLRKSESVKIAGDLFGGPYAPKTVRIIACIAIFTNIFLLIFILGPLNIFGWIMRICCILIAALLITGEANPRAVYDNSAIAKFLRTR